MAKKPSTKKQESELLKALKFVSLAQVKDDQISYKTHCRIMPGGIIAYDGILAAGHPAPFELAACPNTFKMIAALEKIDGTFSLVLNSPTIVSIKAGRFDVKIECLDNSVLNPAQPDQSISALNNKFREALNIAGIFTKEGDAMIVNAAMQTRNRSVIGTNGNVLIEAFHGIAFPPGLNMPKNFVEALRRVDKDIASFGFSDGSFTVYFSDGAWLKTQLYQENLPNVDKVLTMTEGAPWIDIPAGFFDAIRAVLPHSETNRIYFGQDQIQSHSADQKGARFQVPGIAPGQSFDGKYLLALESFIQRVDFFSEHNANIASFYGEKDSIMIRGALARSR